MVREVIAINLPGRSTYSDELSVLISGASRERIHKIGHYFFLVRC
jgi:hypothetical protein